MPFCSSCGTQISGGSLCPACASRVPVPVATAPAVAGGMTDNMTAALAYFTFIPAVIFLVLEPYNRNRFVRFHAWQSLVFNAAWFVLWFVLRIVLHIPFLGWMTIFMWPLISLAGFLVWLILVLKAYQGQMFKLPVLGDIAEKQANAM
jgi:uncharacterized membrane protein